MLKVLKVKLSNVRKDIAFPHNSPRKKNTSYVLYETTSPAWKGLTKLPVRYGKV